MDGDGWQRHVSLRLGQPLLPLPELTHPRGAVIQHRGDVERDMERNIHRMTDTEQSRRRSVCSASGKVITPSRPCMLRDSLLSTPFVAAKDAHSQDSELSF